MRKATRRCTLLLLSLASGACLFAQTSTPGPTTGPAQAPTIEKPPPLRRPKLQGTNKPIDLRPAYDDGWHRADGSTKIAFEAGGGFLMPAGNTSGHFDRGWNASVGLGMNVNRFLGALVQFDYLRMPVSTRELKSLGYPGGNTHIWSVSLNPIVHYRAGRIFGGYVVGGAGLYRTTTEFTATGDYGPCTASICFIGNSNAVLASYYSNAWGVSAGPGFDWKIYTGGAAKIFTEARYIWINNEPNTTVPYKPATARAGMFPVTVGIRW